MTARAAALGVAAIAIALVLAQVLAPASALYHTWQYALALTIALTVLGTYADTVRRGADGVVGRRLLVALAGATIVAVAGLASGLLGPDTVSVAGTPGTVVPIPGLRAAAFFGAADPGAVAHGTGNVTLRRRGAPDVVLGPSTRRSLGESLIYLEPRPAAYIDVFDERGAHITITQPNNASFLSPVLLFAARQRIGALEVPFDTFAAPSQHRIVRALYFTPRDLASFGHARAEIDPSIAALLLSVADDRGRTLGLAFAPPRADAAVGGIRIRATLGSYPALAIAAAPPTWALVAGCALFVAGLGWSAVPARARRSG